MRNEKGERKGVWRKEKLIQGAELQRECLGWGEVRGHNCLAVGPFFPTVPTPGSTFPGDTGTRAH